MGWGTEYKNSLKLIAVEEIFDLLVYRPLAFLIVKIIYPTRITPNHLTLMSIVLGFGAAASFAVGKPGFLTLGALLYVVSNVFDCSDGQLARLKHNGTAVGRIIDGFADLLILIAVAVGICIGYAGVYTDPLTWWILVIVCLITHGIQNTFVDYYRNRYLDFRHQQKSGFEESLAEYEEAYAAVKHQRGKWAERIILYLYLRFSATQRMLVARRKTSKPLTVTADEFRRRNRVILRFWLLIGPTTQITNIVILALFNRIDLFVPIVLFGFNGVMVLTWIVQQIIDRTYKTARA